jgi:hypothetical protein
MPGRIAEMPVAVLRLDKKAEAKAACQGKQWFHPLRVYSHNWFYKYIGQCVLMYWHGLHTIAIYHEILNGAMGAA